MGCVSSVVSTDETETQAVDSKDSIQPITNAITNLVDATATVGTKKTEGTSEKVQDLISDTCEKGTTVLTAIKDESKEKVTAVESKSQENLKKTASMVNETVQGKELVGSSSASMKAEGSAA